MRADKLAKFVSFALLFMAVAGLLYVPNVSAKGVERPVRNDYFLYGYFSEVLNYFSSSLNYALDNNTYSVSLATTTSERLKMIYDEALYYRSKGIPTRVMSVIPPFYSFSTKLVVLDGLVLRFQDSPSSALAAGIRRLVESMRGYLLDISRMRLYDGNRVLRFNVNRTLGYLDSIEKLVSTENFSSKTLSVEISAVSPVLNESVVIFGSTPLNGTVDVYIRGNTSTVVLPVSVSSGMFSTDYTFHRLGSYSIYAIQGAERSNEVNVTVGKIPTTFLVFPVYSAVVNGTVKLSGQLVDLYGNPIRNESVVIRRMDIHRSIVLKTSDNGSFSVEYRSSIPVQFTVSLRYPGDSVHKGASSSVVVKFTKIPVSISLYKKDKKFYGFVEPPLNCTVEVFVNGARNSSVPVAEGQFSFSLHFKVKQKISVYVYYNGSEIYSNATSNVVYLLPPPRVVSYLLVSVFAIAVAGVGLWLWFRRRREEYLFVEPVTGEETASTYEIDSFSFESIREAYGKLREVIISRFGMSRSLTPREILNALKGWSGAEKLEFVTEVHERAIYAGERIPDEVVSEFMKAIRGLIGTLEGVPGE